MMASCCDRVGPVFAFIRSTVADSVIQSDTCYGFVKESNWPSVIRKLLMQMNRLCVLPFRADLRVDIRSVAMPLIAATLAAAALPSAAQSLVAPLQIDVAPETTQLVQNQRSSDQVLPTASVAQSYSGAVASTSSWLGNAIQFEAPRPTSLGQYSRPKFHVGLPSESMRGFLNSAGFDADKCQLPMLRARTKSNGDGDINGTLWLYARCTFR